MEPQKSLLFVDDDSNLLDILKIGFERANFFVKTSLSAKDAWAILNDGFKPDLILLDMHMPNEDGSLFLHKLKGDLNYKNYKVAFLTNLRDPNEALLFIDKKFANECGACGFIRKTDDLEDIVTQVQNLLVT